MKRKGPQFVQFENLSLRNYETFFEYSAIKFSSSRTVIVNRNGFGKTTIFNALKHLGPAPNVQPSFGAENQEIFVKVETAGNRDFVTQYSKLIFIDDDAYFELEKSASIGKEAFLDFGQARQEIFERLSVFWAPKLPNCSDIDLNPNGFPMGIIFCARLSAIFAVRNNLDIDLPIVFDSVFGMIDIQLRKGIKEYLSSLNCQQIWLCSACELDGEEIDYELVIGQKTQYESTRIISSLSDVKDSGD